MFKVPLEKHVENLFCSHKKSIKTSEITNRFFEILFVSALKIDFWKIRLRHAFERTKENKNYGMRETHFKHVFRQCAQNIDL